MRRRKALLENVPRNSPKWISTRTSCSWYRAWKREKELSGSLKNRMLAGGADR